MTDQDKYVLPENALQKLAELREKYEKIRNLKLDDEPSLWPSWLGGIDVAKRNEQVQFIEAVLFIQADKLLPKEAIQTVEQVGAKVTAVRFLIATFLYIEHEITSRNSKSILLNLCRECFGITNQNKLSDEEKDTCFLTAQRLLLPNALDETNAKLLEHKRPLISEQRWREFSIYIANQECLKAQKDTFLSKYPITSFTAPLFGATLGWAGAAFGWAAGGAIARSTSLIPYEAQLATLIGAGMFAIGSGSLGIIFSVQIIASTITLTICQISLSRILELTMGFVGQGAGILVGIPTDLTYYYLRRACSMVYDYYQSPGPKLTGMRIDGRYVIDGQIQEEFQLKITAEKSSLEPCMISPVATADGKFIPQLMLPLPAEALRTDSVDELASILSGKLLGTIQISEGKTSAFESLYMDPEYLLREPVITGIVELTEDEQEENDGRPALTGCNM